MQVGEKQAIDLLHTAGAEPNDEALAKFPQQDFPLDTAQIKIQKQHGKLYLEFPLESDEQIYGFGLQFKNVNQRGKIYDMHVDHYGGRDNGRTHAPVPFYVSSKGYGVLINTSRYFTVYAGTGLRVESRTPPPVMNRNEDRHWDPQPKSDVIEMMIPDQNAEIIVFKGENAMDVVRQYNLYCGGGCLPPKWGLGFTYRTHTLYSDSDVAELADEFERQDFPLDFVGLEPGWMSHSYPCSFEWDPKRFSKPGEFVQKMKEQGVHINLWMNPYVAPKTALYDTIKPYTASHTVWNGIIPDYSMEPARKIFTDFYQKTHIDIGVSGLKIDEVDGYDSWLWPDVAQFPSGTDAEVMRQTYGLQMQKMIADLYHENNTRTFGLIRASNAGASRFPFVLYNDYYKHEDFITALINSGFSGLMWTPEARSSKTGEEWLRRMQAVCFSPMAMINAWASGTKPWSYPEVYEEVKQVAHLRMQLLPYIYSTFAQYHFEGTPPVRPMPLVDGFYMEQEELKGSLDDTENPYELATRKDIKDQYMFGDNLLVAPVFAGQTSRKVILPKGKWYDFYTGELAGEGEVIEIDTPLDRIPLFVRDGGIIPMIPKQLHMPNKDTELPLEIRYYGEAPGEFTLYDDDGESFNYENGYYSLTRLHAEPNKANKLEGSAQREYGEVFNYNKMEWKAMSL